MFACSFAVRQPCAWPDWLSFLFLLLLLLLLSSKWSFLSLPLPLHFSRFHSVIFSAPPVFSRSFPVPSSAPQPTITSSQEPCRPSPTSAPQRSMSDRSVIFESDSQKDFFLRISSQATILQYSLELFHISTIWWQSTLTVYILFSAKWNFAKPQSTTFVQNFANSNSAFPSFLL